ncbi:MAG: hemolysin family protein [Acidobacteria bacterium]|jgi:putative hemolysin|nr:hemolysin family protein [Acidobacteriota bacterium]
MDPAASPQLIAAWLFAGLALLALYAVLSLAVGARLAVGRLAAERVADESGLNEPLDPGSRLWSAAALVRQVSLVGLTLVAGFAPLPGAGAPAAALSGLVAVVFGRVAEALVAPRAPERLLSAAAPLLRVIDTLFGWLVAPLVRRPEEPSAESRTRTPADEEAREEQLEEYIRDAEEEGLLEREQSEIMREIADTGDLTVREIMTPRTEIAAVEADEGLEELARAFNDSRHSRLLVYDDTLDRVVGVVAVRDILPYLTAGDEPLRIRNLMRPVPLVPSTKKVLELMRELQQERQQMAVVVDEYGGTSGLVTLEDLVEEIVGEIRDEHETDACRPDGRGGFIADGLLPVDDLVEALGVDLASDGVDTVGGLVFSRMGRVPRVGDRVTAAPGIDLEVVRMIGRRIATVRVSRAPGGDTA